MLCRYTYAHFMHITIKTLQMREAQEVQSCARICPCSVTSLLTLTSPGDSPWNPNPDSVPFTHFFPGLNYPLCPVSSPSWDLQESIPCSGCGMSTSHHAGAMGTAQPLSMGTGQGPGTLPRWGITPQTPPTSKPGSAEQLWKDFTPAQQCKIISSLTALQPACHPWVHNGKTLYKFLDHICTYFITKSSYRNDIDMPTLPSELILHHILKSLLLSQAFCRWATAKSDGLYLDLALV